MSDAAWLIAEMTNAGANLEFASREAIEAALTYAVEAKDHQIAIELPHGEFRADVEPDWDRITWGAKVERGYIDEAAFARETSEWIAREAECHRAFFKEEARAFLVEADEALADIESAELRQAAQNLRECLSLHS